MERITRKTYEESGLFSQVSIGSIATDIQASVEIVDQARTLIGHPVMTLTTLRIIPAKEGHEFRIKTVLKSRAGKVLGIFEKSEGMTLWIHLLLAFATPFSHPSSVEADIITDMNRATINEAHRQGIL